MFGLVARASRRRLARVLVVRLFWGARSSRPLPSASRRRAGDTHVLTPFSEWILPPRLFGETPVCVYRGRDIALRCPRRVQRRNFFVSPCRWHMHSARYCAGGDGAARPPHHRPKHILRQTPNRT